MITSTHAASTSQGGTEAVLAAASTRSLARVSASQVVDNMQRLHGDGANQAAVPTARPTTFSSEDIDALIEAIGPRLINSVLNSIGSWILEQTAQPKPQR